MLSSSSSSCAAGPFVLVLLLLQALLPEAPKHGVVIINQCSSTDLVDVALDYYYYYYYYYINQHLCAAWPEQLCKSRVQGVWSTDTAAWPAGAESLLHCSRAVCREAVQRAMLTCPRGSFVPEGYRAEAWVDSPIRVEEDDFNISAPHM
jgi:hypothetical protein